MFCIPKVTKCCSYFYSYMNYRLLHDRFCVDWDCSFKILEPKFIQTHKEYSYFLLNLMLLDKSKKVKFYIQQELKVKFEDLSNKS